MKTYSYFTLLAVIYSVCLVVSNIASNKLVNLFGFYIDAGFIFFPLTYIINDVLTEVYGFKASRQVIWSALFANLFALLGIYLVVRLPSAADWEHQAAFEQVFALSERIFLASVISYFIGEFINSITLAKMKVITKGYYMPVRFITSTIIGAAIENCLFYLIAFSFALEWKIIFEMMMVQYILKIVYEIIILPFSCMLANFLKKVEQIDYYDNNTIFSPVDFSKN